MTTDTMVTEKARPRLVFVHGIGGPRDVTKELAAWSGALAEGAVPAGGAAERADLAAALAADSAFAHYGDLFTASGAQGAGAGADEEQAALTLDLLAEFLDELASLPGHQNHRGLARVRAQLSPQGEAQGVLNPARHLSLMLASIAALPGLSWGARRLSRVELLGILSQPGRYLRRAEPDAAGRTLDQRVRDRVLRCLDPSRPAIVVAHSLGTVVALEALAEYRGSVALLVTVGSPIATPGVVRPLIRPRPPATPETVAAWADFRDNDDLVVPKRRLVKAVEPNSAGVRPTPHRLTSARFWSHDATTYLRREEVAGPVLEARAATAPRS
ncbi:alpha/beta hydrolase [Kitasatospora sp. NPDC048545]|uniref:alpha/beta hydrolase n=1 Tax=Kitasatospora sp. NPDC048545 TaxID=3157208 RepID=UPI0033C99B41